MSEKPTHYIARILTEQDCADLGGQAQLHGPAYQSEFELLAIYVSSHLFSKLFNSEPIPFHLQSGSIRPLSTQL